MPETPASKPLSCPFLLLLLMFVADEVQKHILKRQLIIISTKQRQVFLGKRMKNIRPNIRVGVALDAVIERAGLLL